MGHLVKSAPCFFERLNMNSIILPIKSEYVKKIICGEKKFEYRKKICKKDIDSIIIYETSPVKKVIGEVIVEDKIICDKEKLWQLSRDYAGIEKEFFDKYFFNNDICCAYKLGKVNVYDKPKNLSEYGINYTIQSFVYI